MSNSTTALLIASVCASAVMGCTAIAAVQPALESVRTSRMIPSNNWVGTLDTPADQKMIDKYNIEIGVGTPLKVAIFTFLIIYCPGYLAILAFKAITRT